MDYFIINKQQMKNAYPRHSLIDHLLNNLQDSSKEGTKQNQQLLTQQTSSEDQKKIILKKKDKRAFNTLHLYSPQCCHHVYKLFNTFGINQTALKTSDFEESFIRTYFYHRIVTKVEKYSNAVVVTIAPSSQTICQPSVCYILERLKSLGNQDSFNLSLQIEELISLLLQLKNQNVNTIIHQDKQSITKCLNMLGSEKFICKFGLYKMAFSNSLIKYFGYQVDEFAVQTIKYRTVLHDFLSSNVYYKIVSHALSTLKLLIQVDLNKITLDQYLKKSIMHFTDYIYSKDYKKSFCDIEYFIPMRGTLCIRINNIIYQSNELKWQPYGGSHKLYLDQKTRIKQKQFKLLNKMGIVPSNWLQNQKLNMAGYKLIPRYQKVQ